MAKRFTENTKWEDGWFRKLSPVSKLFWLFIVDRCDIAGLWEIDWELASFYIGEKVDESILQDFNGRLEKINGSKIWVCKFIEFQYGVLNPAVNLHKSVIKILEKQGLIDRVQGLIMSFKKSKKGSGRVKEGLDKSCLTLKDKEKDKEIYKGKDIKEKEEEDCKEGEEKNIDKKQQEEFFEKFWSLYPKRRGKRVGKKECWDYIKQKIKTDEFDDLLLATENYARSDESKEGFARDPIRFLKKDYWKDWIDITGKLKFDEDTEFVCVECKQVKKKFERQYGNDGKPRCRICYDKYIQQWEKEQQENIQKYKEEWKNKTTEEKQQHIALRKRFNLPIPDWMEEGEK